MNDSQLKALVGRTNAATIHGRPPGTLLVDDFEIVPGFSCEAITIHLIHDPDGWDSSPLQHGRPATVPVELPPETMWLRYSVAERFPDQVQADEFVVVMGG
jgi:hypothetical protein